MPKKNKFFLTVGLLLFFLLLIISFFDQDQVEGDARKMLAQYRLHPAAQPTTNKFKLPADSGDLQMVLIHSASQKIGLDIQDYRGQEVKLLKYPLQERSQSGEGKTYAYFLADNHRIIGAYLALDDYTPGIVSLDDRSYFTPDRLKPEKLVFEGVDSIELYGPWENNDWKNKATITDTKQVNSILSLLSQSTPINKDFPPHIDYEEYLLVIHYSDGPKVYARLISTTKTTKATLDHFPDWSYDPPQELKAVIKELLSET
ncbi:MAG: DUF4830 domain-containing protein [Syntrophaceticus schinkii]|jgi:hypothetical protein|nr:DUF4830 domain-containing protein [Syntrophaceticus schinkii]